MQVGLKTQVYEFSHLMVQLIMIKSELDHKMSFVVAVVVKNWKYHRRVDALAK